MNRLLGGAAAGSGGYATVASVRVRATVAATLVVAAALGVAAVVLIAALRGSLEASAGEEAVRRATAAATYTEYLGTQTLDAPAPGTQPLDAQALDAGAERGEAVPYARTTPGEAVPYSKAEPIEGAPRVQARLLTGVPIGRTTPLSCELLRRAEPGACDAVTGSEPQAGVMALKPVRDPDILLTQNRGGVAIAWAQPHDYVVATMDVTTSSGPATVWARVSLASAEAALHTLNSALLPGVPALLLVVAGMTWLSVGRALAPVAAIRAKLADITARDLHQRVPVPEARDEIAALAATVNDTLDRLETAVGTHQRFVADAAHELRSPIATLRARLELAEPSELTREALADVERLQALAGDLLLLARLDAGEPPRMDDLDVGQVAAEEALRARRRPEVRLELDVQPDVVVRGAHGHLARLVTNLVDNAVRHARSTVEVRVRPDGEEAVLEVSDDGPGIHPGQREAVFARFTRLDEARARDAGGAGLGLPIARDIAALHGGTLTAVDGGLLARFPLSR